MNINHGSGPQFRTACENKACVEVAYFKGLVHVRDSKDPDGLVLTFTVQEWINFVNGVKVGSFDLP